MNREEITLDELKMALKLAIVKGDFKGMVGNHRFGATMRVKEGNPEAYDDYQTDVAAHQCKVFSEEIERLVATGDFLNIGCQPVADFIQYSIATSSFTIFNFQGPPMEKVRAVMRAKAEREALENIVGKPAPKNQGSL